MNTNPEPTPADVEKVAKAICRSGKFESGQGTCSLLCMEFPGDPRGSIHGCPHAAKIHGKLAESILSSLPSEREQIVAWRDIATAPKDGSPLRLYDPELDEDSSFEGHWTDCTGETGEPGWVAAVWTNMYDDWLQMLVKPTHWMPHPSPPHLPTTEQEEG